MKKLSREINYVNMVCDPGSIEPDNFGGILTDIDANGYAVIDFGYMVKLEHILNIKLEENILD
jgi:hypothetical protein